MKKNNRQLLEGSQAIALTIRAIRPAVVSAYPITPQTHIVEDLAQFKADGEQAYEYVRAESEFAAASIVLGASAAGSRVYSATSSQGLLLMAEVIYNISGMRLPVVMTVANRAVSAPINIWNDHSDIMGLRDAGAILLFAETHQEAINQHVLAYKIAEQLSLPVFVNVDGFILTHSYEGCQIPETELIKKFLPDYQPKTGEFLDPKNPITMGMFAGPQYYFGFRKKLQTDLISSAKLIEKEYKNWKKIFNPEKNDKAVLIDNGLIEYYGPKNPKTILVTLGTLAGTIKQVIDDNEKNSVGLIKIRCYRPFPGEQIRKMAQGVKRIITLEKTYGLGYESPIYLDLAAALYKEKIELYSEVLGLGGQDITEVDIKNIIKKYEK
jgi:pyruvate ferredoxin oxidoreductase alpha subunit